jgi:hypothetical protein
LEKDIAEKIPRSVVFIHVEPQDSEHVGMEGKKDVAFNRVAN